MLVPQSFTLKAVVMLFVCGCASAPHVRHPRISIIDDSLLSDITIKYITSVKNESGLLEVRLAGLNNTSSYKKLEYKINWLDRAGFKIPTILSRWTAFSAFESAEFSFSTVAPNKSATDFRILIRKAD